jgi:hypothetical protein
MMRGICVVIKYVIYIFINKFIFIIMFGNKSIYLLFTWERNIKLIKLDYGRKMKDVLLHKELLIFLTNV